MSRKIEIEISENMYLILSKAAEELGSTLEEYVSLRVNEGLEGKELQAAKKVLIKVLQDTIKRVEDIKHEELEFENKGSKILVYSYQSLLQQSSSLSKEIADRIENYKDKGWFNERLFYFIISKKEIVGLIGMQTLEEPMPYGQYLCIYSLYLGKSLQTKKNLNYLAGYIQAIAKQEKLTNVDISNVGTNLSKELLKGMGFYSFSSANYLKGRIKASEIKVSIDLIKQVNLNLTKAILEEYILTERTLPIQLLINSWEKRSNPITIEKISFPLDTEELSYILIKELVDDDDETENRYTILVQAGNLYDIERLELIYKNAFAKIYNTVGETDINLCIPKEIQYLESFIEVQSSRKLKWFRRLVTSN